MTLHLSAGRYAVYLWPAYGLSALVIAALIAQTLASERKWRRLAEGTEAASETGP